MKSDDRPMKKGPPAVTTRDQSAVTTRDQSAEMRRNQSAMTTPDILEEAKTAMAKMIQTVEAAMNRGRGVSYMENLPTELLQRIMLFVPPNDVYARCTQVCRRWMQVCQDQRLWKLKCIRDGKYDPSSMDTPPTDFVVFYFCSLYSKNLLWNSRALNSLRWWKVRGGSSYLWWFYIPWAYVDPFPSTVPPIKPSIPPQELNGLGRIKSWTTSCDEVTVSQTIDLKGTRCFPELLHHKRPPIEVSAWCATHQGCESTFRMCVTLQSDKKTLIRSIKKKFVISDDEARKTWHKVKHVFDDYHPAIRYIHFEMGGSTVGNWFGFSGPHFTLPRVRFLFNTDSLKHLI